MIILKKDLAAVDKILALAELGYSEATATAAVSTGGLNGAIILLKASMGTVLPVVLAVSAAVAAIAVGIHEYKKAHPTLEQLRADADKAKQELEEMRKKVDDVNDRIKELQALKENGGITQAEQKELDNLIEQNEKYKEQLNLLEHIADLKQKIANSRANDEAIGEFEQFLLGDNESIARSNTKHAPGMSQRYLDVNKEGVAGLKVAIEDYQNAKNEYDKSLAEYESFINKSDYNESKDYKRANDLKEKVEENRRSITDYEQTIADFQEKLVNWRGDISDENVIQQIDQYLDLIDSAVSDSKITSAFDKFQKNVKSLSSDITKALASGNQLTRMQKADFEEWAKQAGYTKEDIEDLVIYFQRLLEINTETPVQENVRDRVTKAREEYQKVKDDMSKLGIDASETIFGNIDADNRQILDWTDENIEKYKDALKSWGEDLDEIRGEYSTIMGTSREYDGLEIAFTPILQTDHGPELLSADTVDKYVRSLLDKAHNLRDDGTWTTEDFLDLDAHGVEIDGKKIKGLIADVGRAGTEAGEEVRKIAEAMHYVGNNGELARVTKELDVSKEAAHDFIQNFIAKDIANFGSLRDELAKTGEAWQEYNKILEGGDRGDAAKQMAQAYQKAMEDIEKGRFDTKAVWGVAKLLYSDEQLADMKYDLTRIVQELSGPMMKALFGGDDDTDIGIKFANYIKENAARLESAGARILDQGNGKFQFLYDSHTKLAKALGMSDEALTALLDDLNAYGVQSMQSGQDATELANKFYAIQANADSAKDAVKEFIQALASGENALNEHEIIENLKMLRANGVITGDDKEFSDMIHDVMATMDTVDKTESSPTVKLNDQATDPAINLRNNLEAIFATPLEQTVVVNEVQGTTVSSGDSKGSNTSGSHYSGSFASGTKDAPGGVTLVNEKGPELISDNGVAYIANGGKPGFVNLGKGAVVFTAGETKEIFSKGYSNIPVRAYADGTENRASLRDRLINGGNARALAYGTKQCPECGYTLREDATRCPNCGWGYQQPSQYKPCPECGYMLLASANKCPNCGWGYPKPQEPAQPQPQPQPYNPTPVYNNTKPCPECGYTLHIDAERCPNCGWGYKTYESPQDLPLPYIPPQSPGSNNPYSGAPYGGSSGYTGGGGGSSVGSADYAEEAEPEKVDWIAVLLNRIQRKIADLEKVASSGFKSLSTRLKAGNDEVAEINKEIGLQRQAYDRYIQEANSVGLSDELKKKVQDGTIDINEYDQETRELIDKYETWYEKALDAKYAIEELTQEVADIFLDMFNATQTDFENQLSMIEHSTNMVELNMREATARGYLDSTEYYKQLIDLDTQSIAKMEEELGGLQQRFQEAMDSGTIEMYSEAWYSMAQSINSVEESIRDANIRLIEYSKTMRNIKWSYFDYMMTEFGQLQQEANFLIGVMANDKLFDDIGKFAEKGTATMGLRVMNYNAYMKQADEYAKEMRNIERDLAQSPYDTELIERRRTLLGLQQQMIQAAESEKDAMKDLVSQGIQLELSALKDLIDEYEKSLDSAKDLYDYQKKISEKTGDVAKLQKQLTAYRGDNSEENRARIQKLEEELRKAQEDLEETEYEQNIADQKKLLSELYDEYEEYLNTRLDDLETLVKEMVDGVNINADTIRQEINSSAAQVGYTITDGMSDILASGTYAYYDKMFDGVTSINGYLDSINQKISEMIAEADRLAKELAASIQMSGFGGGGQAGSGSGSGRPANVVEGYFGSDGTFWYPPDENGDQLGTDVGQIGKTYYDTKTGKYYYWDGQKFVSGSAPAGSAEGIGMLVGSGGYKLKVSEKEALKKLDEIGYGWIKNIGLVETSSLEILDEVMDEIQRKKPEAFNEIFGYGGLADYTGLAMIHGSKDKPELVLNADDTEKFLAAAKLMRTPVLEALTSKSFDLGSVNPAQSGGGDIYFGDLNFQIDRVQDYNDFVSQLRDDPKFEKLVNAITFDRMSGKSSFGGKNRIRFGS